MIRTTALLTAVLLAPAGVAHAQYGRGAEVPADRHELRQDGRERRDDRRDLRRLEDLLARFDRARARRDRGALAAVDRAVEDELAREWRETRVEMARDRQEIRRDVRDGDRRDFRDDRRDAAVERGVAGRRGEIAQELRSLRGRFGPPALDRKRALLDELVGLARAELAQDRQEIREDRREGREDGRDPRGNWR
jgi:hypothetical protein